MTTPNTFSGTIELITPSKYDESQRLKIDNGWYGCWLNPLPSGVQNGASVEFTLNNSGKGIADIWLAGQHPRMATQAPAQQQPVAQVAQAVSPQQAPATHKDMWIFAAGAMNQFCASHKDMKPEDMRAVAIQAVRAARAADACFRMSDDQFRRLIDGGTPKPAGVPAAPPPAQKPADSAPLERAPLPSPAPTVLNPDPFDDDIPF